MTDSEVQLDWKRLHHLIPVDMYYLGKISLLIVEFMKVSFDIGQALKPA